MSSSIANLKAVIQFGIRATQEVIAIDDNKDKKISFGETLEAITSIGLSIPPFVTAIANVKEEWKDLSREELDELVQWFTEAFDIPSLESGKIEAIVKKTAAMIVYNYNYYRDIRALHQ